MKKAAFPHIAALALVLSGTACNGPPAMDEDSVISRAQLVRACPSGMNIGQDPVSGRLVWSTMLSSGIVANGVRLEQVCAR